MKIMDYDEEKHAFSLLNSQSNNEIYYIPFCLPDVDASGKTFKENPEDYGYELFYRRDFVENDIFQVEEKSLQSRIGWIFPVVSIISNSHDYADNPHFCRYAYLAHFLLITSVIKEEEIVSKDFFQIISDDFANQNAIIFIYKKALVQGIDNYKIKDYFCSFYKYGYYLKDEIPNPVISHPSSGKIVITRISKCLIGNSFIDNFINTLYYEKYPIIKFHILYQIIELLIEDVFVFSLECTIKDFKDKKIYARSLRERISKVESEKDRINMLMEWCAVNEDVITTLNKECNDFLQLKRRPSFNFPESLYAFRNFIVHDFRHMTNDIETVENINNWFELFIFDILTSYTQKV